MEMIQATGPTALFSFCQFCRSASSNLCVRRNLALPLEPHEPLNEQRIASLRLDLSRFSRPGPLNTHIDFSEIVSILIVFFCFLLFHISLSISSDDQSRRADAAVRCLLPAYLSSRKRHDGVVVVGADCSPPRPP